MLAHDTVAEHVHIVGNGPSDSLLDHVPAAPTGDARSLLLYIVAAGTIALVLNNGTASVVGILQGKIRSFIWLAVVGLVAVSVYANSLV